MTNDIIKIKWLNSENKSWITDYLNDDKEQPYCISVADNSRKYEYCVPKKMADDLYAILEITLSRILNKEAGEVKIINLSMCRTNNGCVTGHFETVVGQFEIDAAQQEETDWWELSKQLQSWQKIDKPVSFEGNTDA